MWKFHMIFSCSPLKISFLGLPWNFHILFRNSMSFFFWNFLKSSFTQLHWQLYIFPVFDVVNILLQKFYTLSKKETLTQKAAFLSLLWTRPIDLWGNMLETLEKQRKYRWKEIVGGKHFICCSYLSIYFGMNIFC